MRKAFRNIKHITLRGRRFRIILCSRLGPTDNPNHGECSDPRSTSPMIRYYVGLSGERRLDVLIHEMLHACFWDISEEGIQFSATDIARSLWRLGYRLPGDRVDRREDPPKYIMLRNKRYRYERVAGLPTGINGYTTRADLPNKTIKVRVSLKGEEECAALLKYMLFACYCDMSEESIRETADDIAKALFRMGYSRDSII